MLEVKNLKKIYKTNKGTPVHALDGVTLRFPETGMVFLLGKSGSGKSTLLNVCGGLDSPTEGEVIVKGRSSKNFSQSDFDSYRNTFVGFIFQEYNILNEFSVEDNIALALELQGKPKDRKTIAALLEQVDLSGYAKRKPNTLSGGQKQRIAIARALVKKPEIIMADEPTGALDSNTGKQVFDTLKKLSRDKLVIVVSHDREFAEQYGDRIIELKDGQVLSDVCKTQTKAESISENMSVLGDILCIKKGADLSEQDFESIKKFLKKTDRDVVIAADEKSVKSFKTAARITDNGEMEVFQETGTEEVPGKEYTKEDSRFIRSKLPLRHAFKLGISGMKRKPIRLFFTVLLCSVAFVLFGLLSTLNFYNSEATFRQTMQDSEISAIRLIKQYQTEVTWYRYGESMGTYTSQNDTRFSPAELSSLSAKLNANAFGAVSLYSSFNLQQGSGNYWNNRVDYAAYIPENNSLRSRIQGAYPQKSGEMVISSYFADMLVACKGYDSKGTVMDVKSPEELIGRKITVGGREFTITGILETGEIPEKFDVLKEGLSQENYALMNEYYSLVESGLHLLTFLSQEQCVELAKEYRPYQEGRENYMRITAGVKHDGEFSMPEYSDTMYNSVSAMPKGQKVYAITREDTNLLDHEILLPANRFAGYLAELLYAKGDEYSKAEQYETAEKYYQLGQKASELQSGGIYVEDKEKEEYVFQAFTDAEYDKRVAQLVKVAKDEKLELEVGVRLFDQMNQAYLGDTRVYQIVGLYKPADNWGEATFYMTQAQADALWEQQKVAISDYAESKTNYVADADEIYNVVYLPGNVDADKIDAYWQIYRNSEFGADSSRIHMGGGVVEALHQVDYMVESFSEVFLYVGLVLAVFAALLLSNFISVSIANKKREIGILRAVGARSNDVFKIFFSESFVIGLVCVIISLAASMTLCRMINTTYAAELGASVFVFGVNSIAVLVGIAFLTILVATFLPVFHAAKKKPVDSIRAL